MIHQLDYTQPFTLFTDLRFSPQVALLDAGAHLTIEALVSAHEQSLCQLLARHRPFINGVAFTTQYLQVPLVLFSSTFRYNGVWEEGCQLVRHLLTVALPEEVCYQTVDEQNHPIEGDVVFETIEPA